MAATTCNGCKKKILSLEYLECSVCNALYDLNCVNITSTAFESFTQEIKDLWTCPECLSARPKGGNLHTPVRVSSGWNTTYVSENDTTIGGNDTFSNVNMARGGMHQKEKGMNINFMEIISEIRTELSALRSQTAEVPAMRLDIQRLTKEVENMSLEIVLLKTELAKRESQIVATKTSLPTSKQPVGPTYASRAAAPQPKVPNIKPPTGAQATILQPPLGKINARAASTAQASDENKSVATEHETTQTSVSTRDTPANEWKTVESKRKSRRLPEFHKGGNTNDLKIKGIEQKRFLHVWKVQKTVSVKDMKEYVQSVCGDNVEVHVESVKTRTERDYASFIIGVPESHYDMLCDLKIWHVKVRFSEWRWFRKRRDTDIPNPSQSKS